MNAPSPATAEPPRPPDREPPTPPASGARTLLASVIVLGIAVGGLGYLAFFLWTEGRDTSAALAATESSLAKMRAEEGKRRLDVSTAVRQASEKEAQLSELNAKVLELGGELAAAQSRLEELDAERAEIADRLAEFRRMTEQFRMMIDTGKLEIAFRRGRMIVQLPAQVLFPSGSADLTDEGVEAIGEVAKILRGMRDQHFIVGGHTDTVPVSNDEFSSNWGLSAARAVNVTESLVKAGLKPGQLVAAGYGEFDPVAKNTSQAGRQKNRRIEIILEPKLREIPDLATLEREAGR